MNEIKFNVLNAIISACVFLVTAFVIPYLRSLTENEKLAGLENAVETAVMAVEQTNGKGGGGAKKAEAVSLVAQWLTEHRMSITSEQISQLIESAVFAMNQGKEVGKNGDGETAGRVH